MADFHYFNREVLIEKDRFAIPFNAAGLTNGNFYYFHFRPVDQADRLTIKVLKDAGSCNLQLINWIGAWQYLAESQNNIDDDFTILIGNTDSTSPVSNSSRIVDIRSVNWTCISLCLEVTADIANVQINAEAHLP